MISSNWNASIYTVEFPKRGLPHAHILVFLHPNEKQSTPKKIESIISTELPQKEDEPVAYDTVVQYMDFGVP